MSLDLRDGRASRNHALRLAFAITVGLFVETLRGAPLPMLAPIIAIQILAVPGKAPSAKLALVLLGVIAGASALAWAVSAFTVQYHGLYAIGVAVLYLWAFLLVFTPRTAMLGVMFLTMSVVVSAMTAASSAAAIWIAGELVASVVSGFILIYLAHGLLPHRGGAPELPQSQAIQQIPLGPGLRAFLAACIMLPIHLYMTSDGVAAMVVLLTVATMLRQPSLAQSTRYGVTFACGNAFGGVLAAFMIGLLALHETTLALFVYMLAASLLLTTSGARSTISAQVVLPAMVSFVVLSGLALSPLPLGDEVNYVKRVAQILAAALYALAAISLLAPALNRLIVRPASQA